MGTSKLLRLIVLSDKAWTQHPKCLKITREIFRPQKPQTADGFPSLTARRNKFNYRFASKYFQPFLLYVQEFRRFLTSKKN